MISIKEHIVKFHKQRGQKIQRIMGALHSSLLFHKRQINGERKDTEDVNNKLIIYMKLICK